MSTFAAHSAQARPIRSISVCRPPLSFGAADSRLQGVTAGQPLMISGRSGDSGALLQPASNIRQRLVSPLAIGFIVTFQVLDQAFADGQRLAQLLPLLVQVGLGLALAGKGGLEGRDGAGLAGKLGVAGFPRQLGLGQAGLRQVDALLLYPQEQAEGTEQGGAVQHLAQKAHVLASAQLVCCS